MATGDSWSLHDFTSVRKISEGTYGVVYKCMNRTTGELVAVKKIRLEGENEGIPITALREMSCLQELRHPNIVKLEQVIMQENRLFLIFEFLDMDLREFLDSLPENYEMNTTSQSFLYQACQAICYCHQRRILHRDLKPQNLLVNSNGVIKLADFGLARAIRLPVRTYTHEIVTLWYRAPEILLGCNRYSTGVDIWSIGCVFAEMATRKPLFKGDSEIDQLFQIFRVLSTPNENNWEGVSQLPDYNSKFPLWQTNELASNLNAYMSHEAIELLQQMLMYDPSMRISAKQILVHPYFNDLDRTGLPAGHYDGTLQLDN
ncbi:Cyclin-dependent kinase 1 [Toxocara canis]|uniref:Cyclin-dependent kinase 1 n=1 Tax=Toxocara canis TaxID=6265 RepID=A0A0B2VGE7_TOXCA|nr:Cyclin-dependent kinase 1 [Toxocara canis]